MLVATSLNFGYLCGELQAVSAAARIVRHFPWVLYSSGPDSLPTPNGLLMLGHAVRDELTSQVCVAIPLMSSSYVLPSH